MKNRIPLRTLIATFTFSIVFSYLGIGSASAQDAEYISVGNQKACSEGLCNKDIPAILEADDANPIRFRQKYFGKRISGYMTLDKFVNYSMSASAILFDDKGNRVGCNVNFKTNKASLDVMAELEKGDIVSYSAIIDSTAMGRVVHLKNCSLRKASPSPNKN